MCIDLANSFGCRPPMTTASTKNRPRPIPTTSAWKRPVCGTGVRFVLGAELTHSVGFSGAGLAATRGALQPSDSGSRAATQGAPNATADHRGACPARRACLRLPHRHHPRHRMREMSLGQGHRRSSASPRGHSWMPPNACSVALRLQCLRPRLWRKQ